MGERSGIGFTGSRKASLGQEGTVGRVMHFLWAGGVVDNVLRHGNCKGADEAAHLAVTNFRNPWFINVYPGPPTEFDAGDLGTSGGHVVTRYGSEPFLERNKTIVDASQLCLAVVDGPERARSGTWSTVRYARKTGVPVVILWPDTTVTVEAPGHGWIAHVIKDALERAGFEIGGNNG